jgi:hypothetical protein
MTARSGILRLAVLGLLLSRAPRGVQRVVAYMALGVVITIVVIVFAVTAHGAELLIALMQDEAGRRTIHQASLKDGYCVELVTRFGKQAKNGLPVTLTLPEPDFTGIVVEAYCVMPDGSTGARFKAPTI